MCVEGDGEGDDIRLPGLCSTVQDPSNKVFLATKHPSNQPCMCKGRLGIKGRISSLYLACILATMLHQSLVYTTMGPIYSYNVL